MNTIKSFLSKPASLPLVLAILITVCLACNFQKTGKHSDLTYSNSIKPSKTPVISNQTSPATNTDSMPDSDDAQETDVYSENNLDSEIPSDPTNDASSGNFYVGKWLVKRPNAYGAISLTVDSNGTYFWKDGLTDETFTGRWETDGVNLILKKGYKDVDWLVKPADKSESSEDMIFISENGAGMASIFFRGTRSAE